MLPSTSTYVEPIRPTYENAKAIQKLRLQDVRTKGFVMPQLMADPEDNYFVGRQLYELTWNKDMYIGYYHKGELLGYVRQSPWRAAEELPYAHGIKALLLRAVLALRLNPSFGKWGVGVYQLVVRDGVEKTLRNTIFGVLLHKSFANEADLPQTVNMVLHENDPVLDVIEWYGFVPVGERMESFGASGFWQRYERRADK